LPSIFTSSIRSHRVTQGETFYPLSLTVGTIILNVIQTSILINVPPSQRTFASDSQSRFPLTYIPSDPALSFSAARRHPVAGLLFTSFTPCATTPVYLLRFPFCHANLRASRRYNKIIFGRRWCMTDGAPRWWRVKPADLFVHAAKQSSPRFRRRLVIRSLSA